MTRELIIEYEVFEEQKITVLSVIDKEKDEVLNIFRGDAADRLYMYLTEVEEKQTSVDELWQDIHM